MDDDDCSEQVVRERDSSVTSVYNMAALQQHLDELKDIPNALIFTNLSESIFRKEESNADKAAFEQTLQRYDSSIKIAYLKNFRRARVEFSSGGIAALVKYELHKTNLCGTEIKAFFVQIPPLYDTPEKSHLNPPKLEKQFLISPPASPPVGWEPITEHQPIINYDLLHAICAASPEGGSHELHTGSENIPKIIVHLTSDNPDGSVKKPIEHTRRPGSPPPR